MEGKKSVHKGRKDEGFKEGMTQNVGSRIGNEIRQHKYISILLSCYSLVIQGWNLLK